MKVSAKSRLRSCCLVGLLISVSSCATTINQAAVTTVAIDSSDVDPVTVDATLTTDELLNQMLQSLDALSIAMQQANRKLATQHLDQVVAIGEAVRPEIVTASDQLAADFDRIVALAKSAVERNRPADADKALRFLPLIVESLKNF